MHVRRAQREARTVDLTPAARTRLQHAAAVTGRPVDDLVNETIQEWPTEVLESEAPERSSLIQGVWTTSTLVTLAQTAKAWTVPGLFGSMFVA